MQRRTFLLAASAFVLAPGCRKPVSRETVLSAFVHDAVVPDIAAIADTSRKLDEATTRWAAEPSPVSLAAARAAWKLAALAWKRGAFLRVGPLAESSAAFRTTFWPARGWGIDALIAGQERLDGDGIETLGADLKGLYALEYALFGDEPGSKAVPPRFSGPHSARALAMTQLLARDVRSWADKASAAAANGGAYEGKLLRGSKASLDELVNQLAAGVEAMVKRMQALLDAAAHRPLRAADVEGWPSGTSTELLLAAMGSVETLYRGRGHGGLSDLVAAAAPDVDRTVHAAMDEVSASLRSLGGPVEQSVVNQRAKVERIYRATNALEIELKTGVASALGTTLTFLSGDAD